MPGSIFLSSLLIAAALGALAWSLAGAWQPARSRSLANLQRGLAVAAEEGTSSEDVGFAALVRRVTPSGLVALLERQHARAGRPAQWPVERLLKLKGVWVVIALGLLLLVLLTRQQPILVVLTLVTAIVGYFVPDLLLLSRGQERAQKVQLELADTLDQMTIAVEAGLGFDAALNRAAANGKGVLAEELTRTMQDLRMGRSRREAFHDLALRNDVVDLKRFVRAILQADAYGISVGDVLRTQAAEMRLKRRQRAEAAAQKVPVKVLMPLMLCIMPVLFIVVLGPVAITMIGTFSGME